MLSEMALASTIKDFKRRLIYMNYTIKTQD